MKGEICLSNFARNEKITEIVISKREMPKGEALKAKHKEVRYIEE